MFDCEIVGHETTGKFPVGISWGERKEFFEIQKYFEQKLLNAHLCMCRAMKISLFV
jgi:hypothetical protein